MKVLKKIALFVVAFCSILTLTLYIFNFDYLIKAVRVTYLNGYETAFLDDYNYFDKHLIEKSKLPQPWHISKKYNQTRATATLENLHKKIGTVAFLIIKNDSILSENYYDNYTKDSKSNSFSMAKSVVSAALGKAILQGKIKNLNQKVSDFFPVFSTGKSTNMTVGDLSSMASGLDWNESCYSPFSITTRAYFDKNLTAVALGQKSIDYPGKAYKYLSGNTQLLAMCIEKATNQSLADYVSEFFWSPMGAENEAYWQTDHENGLVKAYCCIASNARDFARFGKLYLQDGKWNGKQILDSSFVALSTKPRFKESPEYGYGWWLCDYMNKKIFYMRGHLGQYVIVIPQDKLIIVRLGHSNLSNRTDTAHSQDFYAYIEETYKMLEKK